MMRRDQLIRISGQGVDLAEDKFMELVNLETRYETGDDRVEKGISKRIETLKRQRGILVTLEGLNNDRGGDPVSKNKFIHYVYQDSTGAGWGEHAGDFAHEWMQEMYIGTQDEIAREVQNQIRLGNIEVIDPEAPPTDDPTESIGGTGRLRSIQIEQKRQQMLAAFKDGTLFEKYPNLKEDFDEFLRDRGLDPDSPDFEEEFHRRLDEDSL